MAVHFLSNDSTGSGYVIKAPISGFIVEKNVTVGMDIRSDATIIFSQSVTSKKCGQLQMFMKQTFQKFRSVLIAEVTTLSYPGKKFMGKIERISNILDPETKVMSVKIRLENQGF